ncbi:LysR substrate-binding domain-containing protein [Patulibacter sp. NPDC049589]|uniref:LysR family transcriptional regulator n=1 Tax=Patulibacter sp. NPDC049589 TaxID=3154731 RepID=UPI00343D809D
MELRHLAAFATVAETLHFGHAADRLRVAQPAVSQLVARLERELGVVLFERTSHRVALTPAGAALLPDAQAALGAAERLRDQAAGLTTGTIGTLRVATTTAIGRRLAAALRTLAARHPGVRVELPVLTTTQKLEAVRAGTADVALFRSSPDVPAGLRSRVVWREPFVAVVPAEHAAAATDPVVPSALAGLPMVGISRAAHPAMADEVRAVCAAMGLDPSPGPAVRTPQEVLATVATGAAWTLFVDGNVPDRLPGIAVRALPAGTPASEVRAIWRATGAGPWPERFVAALEATTPAGD